MLLGRVGGRRWGRVLTGLPGEGTAEAGEQTVEIVVGSPGAPGCLQLSGTCLALRAEGYMLSISYAFNIYFGIYLHILKTTGSQQYSQY